ncbi:hypothetical protein CFK38_04990 [Brachybacterium vulturis]|uniref:DUF456 domain-containing protein n=1 Tax=Brachybacterium vulturis TaxID=2017484 RepID=A0A291GL97_9MICO|nr:hypothetical protein CFK38_04990 [Brachybacterium vulturis]
MDPAPTRGRRPAPSPAPSPPRTLAVNAHVACGGAPATTRPAPPGGPVDSLTVQIIVTVLVGIAYVVGLTGIVVPVLPGTITIVIAAFVWAIVIGGWAGWVTFAIALVLGAIGMTTSYVLTGRRLHAAEVPMWPIYVAIASGIVGIFVIPFLGLPLGFLLGLYIAEAVRQKDFRRGLTSAWVAMKALGLGILIEFSLAMLSTIAFAIAVVVHFVTA